MMMNTNGLQELAAKAGMRLSDLRKKSEDNENESLFERNRTRSFFIQH